MSASAHARLPLERAGAIVQPGRNCWRVDRADRFACLQDAADYFRLVRQAILEARDSVFIVGWDFASTVDLAPDLETGEPTRIDKVLAFASKRRPGLRVFILTWDYGAVYTLEREPLTRWRMGWRTPRRVRLGFDDHHPVGASHHQKFVVVDDQLAFCGGIDLTSHRWDTPIHRLEEPARKTIMGLPYGPYHEVQAMTNGPVAAAFGVLARERWRALGVEHLPAPSPSRVDLWPSSVQPDLTDVDVAIARTVPPSGNDPAIRECEALFHDSIARAERFIYIENQYFTDEALTESLARRLREPHGPEVIVVVPKECFGWLERQSMGAFRDIAFRHLADADRFTRLRLVYPLASRQKNVPTFVHSKVMIVDDELVRIGSANFASRSMGMDTECDVAVEAAGDPRVRAGIRRIRDRLLAEHLAMAAESVSPAIAGAGSLRALIDAHQHHDRTLAPVEPVTDEVTASSTLRSTLDPGEPLGFGPTIAQLVPPIEERGGRSPRRLWILPAIAIVAVAASSPAVTSRPEFEVVRDALQGTSGLPAALWIGASTFIVAGTLLVPLELLTIAAALAFGADRGGTAAAIGWLVLALIGYGAGRLIGASGVGRWISRRSYRSVRQLGAHGVIGVMVLRLSSVASSGAINLLCGAGRVPCAPYLAGTVIAMVPAILALSLLGGALRATLLNPSLSRAATTAGLAVALIAIAGVIRMFLLIRQFAPSMASHRGRAEFG